MTFKGKCEGSPNMAQQTTADERTSIKTPDDSRAEITVGIVDERGAPKCEITGKMVTHYSDTRYLLETEDGRQIVVDRKNGYDARAYELRGDEELGRPAWQTVDVPEKGENDHDGQHSTELGADVSDLVEGL